MAGSRRSCHGSSPQARPPSLLGTMGPTSWALSHALSDASWRLRRTSNRPSSPPSTRVTTPTPSRPWRGRCPGRTTATLAYRSDSSMTWSTTTACWTYAMDSSGCTGVSLTPREDPAGKAMIVLCGNCREEIIDKPNRARDDSSACRTQVCATAGPGMVPEAGEGET